MVSSYLVCDQCGGFGPPASFLSADGLRLCYQCWYRERLGEDQPPAAAEPAIPDSTAADPGGVSAPDQSRNSS
jgi:hypothetical protein